MAFCAHPGKFWMNSFFCTFLKISTWADGLENSWVFPKKSFEASPRCIQKWHVWDLSRRAKLIHISREILPKNSEKAVSSKSCWKETAGTIVNISHTWAEKLKIVSNLFSCFSDERGYVWGNWCRQRGSCTKDGITRHLSRLAGAPDDDDRAQDDDHGHDDDDHAHDELICIV